MTRCADGEIFRTLDRAGKWHIVSIYKRQKSAIDATPQGEEQTMPQQEIRTRKTADRTITMQDVFVDGVKVGHFYVLSLAGERTDGVTWAARMKANGKPDTRGARRFNDTKSAVAWIVEAK